MCRLSSRAAFATPIWTKSEVDATAMQAKVGDRLARDYGEAMNALRQAAAQVARRGISPDAVAAAVEHALTAATPKTRYLVGRDARLRALVARFIPDRMRDRLIIRALKLPQWGGRRNSEL